MSQVFSTSSTSVTFPSEPAVGFGDTSPGTSGGTLLSPTPGMPVSPGGNYSGAVPIAPPQARLLPLVVQRLLGQTNFYAASNRVPFPFVLRSALLWAPAATIGASSDGVIDTRVSQDPSLTAANFNFSPSLWYPPSVSRQLWCPTPLYLNDLWIPFPEGNQYLLINALSAAGATNVHCVCVFGITPLADIQTGG